MKIIHLFILCLNLTPFVPTGSLLLAQKSPFKAGVMLGANLSQIDGDHQFGYDKSGITFGLRGGFSLTKRLDVMTELLYIEKGAVPSQNNNSGLESRKATIDYTYAEVPILLSYYLRKNDLGFYQWNLYAGVSYGRLLKSTSSVTKRSIYDPNISQSLSQEFLNRQDYALLLGINYVIIPNLTFGVRNSFSLNNVYTNLKPERNANGSLMRDTYVKFRNYYISAQIQYDFIAPKVKAKKKKSSGTPARRGG